MKKILLTGATGLVGKRLSQKLHERGYKVEALVRPGETLQDYKSYVWDYNNSYIDNGALDDTFAFIHLAGSPISKRWTIQNRLEIYESRISSIDFIYDQMKKDNITPEVIVSASAIGYYGQTTTNHIYKESDSSGNDFLSLICAGWEQQVEQFQKIGSRVVMLRTAAVLSEKGGFLEKIKKPLDYNLGVVLGSGNQFLPWIHIDDLVQMYIKAIEDPRMEGAYNAAAPDYVDSRNFTKHLAKHLHKKIILSSTPKSLLKLVLGEMALIVTEGSRVCCDKVMNQGFKFKYNNLDKAFADLF